MAGRRGGQHAGETQSLKRGGGAPKGNQFASGKRSRPEPGAPSFVRPRPDRPALTHGGTSALFEARELPIHAVDPASATRPLRELTSHMLPPGSTPAEVRRAWRDDLITSLGGEANLSTQQLWLVEAVTNTFLMLQYLDTWILQRSSLFVSERRGTLLPVVLHRQSIARTLGKLLATLGLERKAKDVDTLESYLARKVDGVAE
jgi:hypothetical protein